LRNEYFTNLPDVASISGSPGLNRTDITVSLPHAKLFTGCDLLTGNNLHYHIRALLVDIL